MSSFNICLIILSASRSKWRGVSMQVVLFTSFHSSLSLGILYLILDGAMSMQLPSKEFDNTLDVHSFSSLSLIAFNVCPFSVLSLSILCTVLRMLKPNSSYSVSVPSSPLLLSTSHSSLLISEQQLVLASGRAALLVSF